MKLLKNKLFITLMGFVVLLIDGQLSDLITTLAGRTVLLQVHLLLIFSFLLLRFLDTDFFTYLLALVLGLIYDSYYLNFIGVAFFMLPIFVYLLKRGRSFFITPTRSALGFFLLIFVYEVGAYGLAYLFHLTTYNPLSFVTYQLVITLVFNTLLFIFLDKIVHKIGSK
ncbi:rod shape-determining protein MreD [Streptococcus sobrinus]|uniref:Rod shape-determining protein MreD n=3 Tax=Streptococcus sobrinus TaxID=1310 RepID=U2J0R4_9STRE|nr:rod shape-determining protein MreD [Streptococcus sobrinus]AWN17981.1 rod shape-determining protein MreD [Streptococcus sobrinus]AWN60743.1 rod shape-determining protein MreD [Streptococcus sobrinus]AWN62615.1 rod shape-determining protein MreD [Streptococcus sobrinus]ERJ73632.1 rod shape-determining protein MreD [Streptococcus sobrinus W1703]OZV21722.1 rod shape-determining protein MreD [Streptococcus sobrinus]